jgi:hypothetical protein
MIELEGLLRRYERSSPQLFSFSYTSGAFIADGIMIGGKDTFNSNSEQPRKIWYELELGMLMDERHFDRLYGNLRELIENGGVSKLDRTLFSCKSGQKE